MNDLEARGLLEDAASDIDVTPAPTERLVRQGHRQRHTARLLRGGGIAVALAVIAGGATWLVQDDHLNRGAPVPATSPGRTEPSTDAPTRDVPAVPRGRRLVGMGPIAVTVPSRWQTTDSCHTPLVESVVFDTLLRHDCEVIEQTASTVHFGPIDSWQPPPKTDAAMASDDLDGLSIERSQVVLWGGRDAPGFRRAAVVLVPSADVAMWVLSSDERVIRQVLNSLQRVPEGSVAIPATYDGEAEGLLNAIGSLGLTVTVREVNRSTVPSGRVLGTEPALGSVVAEGSTVTILVSSVAKGDADKQQLVTYLHDLAMVPADGPDNGSPGGLITLALGSEVIRKVDAMTLGNSPRTWLIHRDTFNGYVGPFSARFYLATDPRTWRVTEGRQDYCPWGRARDVPGFEHDRRFTIEPNNTDSCAGWWGVDVYVDDSGIVEAISLNLVEP